MEEQGVDHSRLGEGSPEAEDRGNWNKEVRSQLFPGLYESGIVQADLKGIFLNPFFFWEKLR